MAILLLISCRDFGCPPEEMVAMPISSNLVEYTVPPPGDVVAAAKFSRLTIKFLKPIVEETFTVAEDVRVTRERAGGPPELIDLFLPEVLHPAIDGVTLQINPAAVLEPGDMIKVSILGRDEIDERAVISVAGYPHPEDLAVRLARTVTARFRIADPSAGQPGSPTVAGYPSAFERGCVDPDWPGTEWVQPHAKLVIRFSEPMGVINIHGEVVGERANGSVAGLDFRSFRGLSGRDGVAGAHTALIRNGYAGLKIGAKYELNILGSDTTDARLPASKDLSGQALLHTYTVSFCTSHARIVFPLQLPYTDIDLRNDVFIKQGLMMFQSTEKVKWILPARGVRFSPVDVTLAEDPPYSFATDVELEPDGSGELCVGAYSADWWPLGTDCLRVYDEKNDHTWGVVGSEGGEIKLGKFAVEFGAADTEVELYDGTRVVLPPSLHEAVEVDILRRPRYGSDAFSLMDTYDVSIPGSIAIDRAAHVSWEFYPDETDLPAPAAELLLGTRNSFGDFLPYTRQLLLPWRKSALAYAFSDTVAAPKEEAKRCNDIATEVPKCCEGQLYYQCNPCPLWCNCHLCGQKLSDIGVCECDHPPDSPFCCYGCDHARSEVSCSCDEAGGCDPEVVAEAKRKRCVDCEVSDCYDVSEAVKDMEGKGKKPKAQTICTCTVNGTKDDQIACWQESPSRFCCEYGAPLASTACDVATASWKDPLDGCEDDWQNQKDTIDSHENEHIRRATENCEWAEQAITATRGCAGTEAEAREQLKLQVVITGNSQDLMNAWDAAEVDTSEEWKVPILDCDCPR